MRKYEPNINQLHISSGWQRLGDTDEQSGQHQLRCQVDCYYGLKEERFEEVCGVADHVQEHGGDKGGQDDGQEVPSHVNNDLNLGKD